jgi:outer membrane receptor protein involved in Fe transport
MPAKTWCRTAFLCSTSALVMVALGAPSAFAQASAANAQAPAPDASTATNDTGAAVLNEVVVTGSTSKRTLLNASVAITAVNHAELDQKAPRGTDDVLELIPGIYVEGTAGPVSNNYSVRGLPGGGQQFIRLEEDGMPAIYGGLNDDEVFQYDLSIDHVEAIEGGTSGILTENAAGASINFISRPLNFDEAGGLARITGASYGDMRGDVWYSAPIKGTILGDNLAFAVSGYIDSTKGVRSSPFTYKTYHFKGQLEKRFDSGGYVRLTYKRWDEHDPYYADQPYSYRNGSIGSVPGLDSQFGNIIGSGFGSITVPDSCRAGECYRTFSELNGIHATGNEYRIDAEKPINDSVSVFAKVRYTQTDWDFNGVFAGSGSGNAGLASAVDYLTPGLSPIDSLLTAGMAAFPTATQFGIKNLSNGQIISASNVGALNALNGNGLLEQTVLNRQLIKLRDWGSDFGVKWRAQGDFWSNSLTLGGMVYSQFKYNDQSGVSTVVNDVKNDSNIYDVVALDGSNNVVGTLSNNGLISYGDWGVGLSKTQTDSQSFYFNDEATFFNRLHLDFGLRAEHVDQAVDAGNGYSEPVPAGTGGIIAANPNAFDGTWAHSSSHESPVSWTIGANYTIKPNLSVYARYADAYQTNLPNSQATELKLYEAGVTYAGYGFVGTIRGFRTEFNNQNWPAGTYTDPKYSVALFGNSVTNGFDLDATYRPVYEPLHAFSVHGQVTYQQSTLNGVSIGLIDNSTGKQIVNPDPAAVAAAAAFYNGNTTQHTPGLMYEVTPQYDLPNHRGSIYVRYKYVGQVFADAGNGLILPGFGVVSVGGTYDITPRLNLNVSVDNVNDTLGLTEGNPRQGPTQGVVNGYFYGRGIVGTNAMAQLTFKF